MLPPLEAGVHIGVAISQGGLEYEGLRSIDAIDDTGIAIGLEWPAPKGSAIEFHSAKRLVRRVDLDAANRMVASFHRGDPQSFPGSTAIQTSTAVLLKLRSGAEAPFVFGVALGSPDSVLAARRYYRGSLRSAGIAPFALLVNGKRVSVNALHAKGPLALGNISASAEFWWLDDARNPLTLRWSYGGDTVQTVRIDFPERASRGLSGGSIAEALGEACRTQLYGVYFDSGSATLLTASNRALATVAAALREHADWRVTIEGHTDDVGDGAANQGLSERRAAAVRAALIERFGVAAPALNARGFGESRPIESNDTLEGRARNRRVEIARDCGRD